MLSIGALLESAEEVATEEEFNPLLPHTAEIIVGAVAFLLLFAFLRKTVFPMFEKAYAARTEAIEGGIKKAEEAQAEAARTLEQYRTQLAEAQTEAARIRDEARADAEGIRRDLLAKAQEERDRIIAAGRESLAAERQSIIHELRTEVGTLAVDLASRIVGESLADEARQRGTVERFLSDLESAEGAAAGGRR
jgi:F-type H+-transporting ATPase subunit b